MIAKGATEISKVCLGSDELSKVCIGGTEIWSALPPMPYDAEIEYLGGNSGVYIPTEIKLTNNHKVELKLAIRNVISNQAVFGYGISNTNSRFLLMTAPSSNLRAYWQGSTRSQVYAANTIYEVIWHKNNVVFKDEQGNTLSSGDLTDLAFTTTYPISIFATRTSETASGYSASCNIYYFKIYNENDELILDLIPVRKGQVGYMFDRVSGQLFGNAGTSSFTLGPDKTGA